MQDSINEVAGFRSLGLNRGTLKDEAVEVVRQALMSGDMKPGRIYSANSLAVQLGVSNSPVREAMMELATKGLLEVVRNRGFRVVEMSDADRREVYDLRMLIEVPAVVQVAEKRLAAPHEKLMRSLLQKTLDTARPENMLEYLDADQAFHMGIVGLLGNRRLNAIIENLRDQSRVRGSYHLAERGVLRQSAEEHGPIVEALLAGDTAQVELLMVSHLDYARPEAQA
ncbi:GntR family transcriptional regulator [Crystallibacter degradans]|uniref:GntR family transcriptional regulator n=1 Tax=Crystallibacter degradans TaxID=2726743 RepID=UPI00147578D7|nr:GntR family transcriptional regulator [Arthrobacter sp. SF27]NMR29134.1 GntR family transcriptional regulator [Arthrobacter sp. SF27]